uniref:Uncharacterized protein n=1 Tax=Arundo donax TaxID=35708 RepID=A0A0A9GSB9_ARUDO
MLDNVYKAAASRCYGVESCGELRRQVILRQSYICFCRHICFWLCKNHITCYLPGRIVKLEFVYITILMMNEYLSTQLDV